MDPIIDRLMRLIHLTDPHLSSLESCSFSSLRGKRRSGYLSWLKRRRHVYRRETLEKLTAAVLAEKPDRILLTGDLLHIGLEHEACEARGWLESLGPPERVVLVPGNHDRYARDSGAALRKHWREWLPAAGYPFILQHEGVRLLALDSAVVTPVFSAAGELGQAQLGRYSRMMDGGQPGQNLFTFVLVHHPPLPGMTRRRKALRDAGAFHRALNRKPPDVLLYGHIHVNRSGQAGSTRYYCTAAASSRDDASYRVFDLSHTNDQWNARMQLKTLDGSTFELTEEESWSTGRPCGRD